MSRAVTATPPVATDIAVVLTGIIRPEPDAGGTLPQSPRFPAVTRMAKRWRKFAPACARLPKGGLPSPTMMRVSPAKRPKDPREDYFRQTDVPRT
jgi:hypothetical protein